MLQYLDESCYILDGLKRQYRPCHSVVVSDIAVCFWRYSKPIQKVQSHILNLSRQITTAENNTQPINTSDPLGFIPLQVRLRMNNTFFKSLEFLVAVHHLTMNCVDRGF